MAWYRQGLLGNIFYDGLDEDAGSKFLILWNLQPLVKSNPHGHFLGMRTDPNVDRDSGRYRALDQRHDFRLPFLHDHSHFIFELLEHSDSPIFLIGD